MRAQGNNFSFDGQNIYIGIDVHLKTWSVSIITESGYREHFSQESKASVLGARLKRRYPGGIYHSVYESGFTGFSTHYSLLKQGIENIIVNASDVPTSQKEKLQKTDKVDAKKLAVSLKNGVLEGIYILSEEEIEFREAVRYRNILVRENTRWKNRIKSLLYRYGVRYPERFENTKSHWSGRFIGWLKELSETSLPVLREYLESYVVERESLATASKRLKLLSRDSRYAPWLELLMSVPGIGFIVGMTLLAEIGSIERFKNESEFASFIGIVPTCHNSGEKESTSGMTFRGNKSMRSMLIEASWTAIRKDPALSACYGKLCKRMEPNDAIIRIARKLSNRILSVLKKKEKYVFGINSR